MAREFFKNLPDTTTPLNATKLNGLLNGEEAMGSIVVDDITCKNISPLSKISTISGGYINRTCGTLGKVTKGVTYTISFVCGSSHTGANSIQIRTHNTESITEAYTTYSSGNRIKSTFTASQDGEIYLSTNLGTTYTDIIYDIQVEKGTVATDYVEHKNFENDKQMITVTNSAEYTIATATTQINLTGYNVVGKIGSKLTVGNTGVIIPAGYTKAIISGQIRYDNTTEGDDMFAYIKRIRGGLILSGASECPKGNRISFILSPKIVEVQEGDILTLAVQNNNGARGKVGYNANASYTYMTVELIK